MELQLQHRLHSPPFPRGVDKERKHKRIRHGNPLFTPLKDVAITTLRTAIILPEGASHISIESPPFSSLAVTTGITKTYLDTVGRPIVTLEKENVSSEHAGLIYVKYRLTTSAHLTKVVATAVVMAGVMGLTGLLQRVETKIR